MGDEILITGGRAEEDGTDEMIETETGIGIVNIVHGEIARG
jgi:hypothetical protein